MKSIMFTRDNALRFWTHNKVTTIRRAGKSNEPRFKSGELASLRIWLGGAYRSKQFEFGTAIVLHSETINIHGNAVRLGSGNTMNEAQRDVLADQDGFDSWNELKAALNGHHGLLLEGFRYCFVGIVLDDAAKLVVSNPAVLTE